MPTDDDYRQALVWRGRLLSLPVSVNTLTDYFAWKKEGRRDAAFANILEMDAGGRATLSALLILRGMRVKG